VRARMTGSALNGACWRGGHHAGGGGRGGRYGRSSTDFGSSGMDGKSGGLRYLLLAVEAAEEDGAEVKDDVLSESSKEADRNVRDDAVLGRYAGDLL
jgi:hypothetical protein